MSRPQLLSLLTLLLSLQFAYAQKNTNDTINEKIHGYYLTINNYKIWIELEGKGEPLVLLSGGPGSSHYSLHKFARLRSQNLLIYVDNLGRGKSDTAKQVKEYTIERDVEDVEGIRKALGFKKISVLGHSYGGLIAQAYAIKYPEQTQRLILADTFFSGEMWQANNNNCNHEIEMNYPEVWERLMKVRAEGAQSSDKAHIDIYGEVPYGFLYAYNAGTYTKSSADSLFPDEKLISHQGIKFNTKVYYQMVGRDGDFIIGGDIAKVDFRLALGKLNMPILIYTGRFDRVAVPKFAIQYKKYVPKAQFVMFEKSGHNPHVEEPEKLFPILEEFMKR